MGSWVEIARFILPDLEADNIRWIKQGEPLKIHRIPVGSLLMLAPFDIFRLDSEDRMLWVGSAGDLETAKARIRELMKDVPADYLIFSLKTQHKMRIKKGEEIV